MEIDKERLSEILELHKKWMAGNEVGKRANLRYANLGGANLKNADLRYANLDYSCLPLWCGSLKVHMDDKQVKQLLYHTLSIAKHSKNVSEDLKTALLTEKNLEIANQFHKVEYCGEL